MTLAQMPTLPGKAEGIVGWEPCVLQCRQCGTTATQQGRSVGAFIILSGFHFHGCEGRTGMRLCPPCLEAAQTGCSNRQRHER